MPRKKPVEDVSEFDRDLPTSSRFKLVVGVVVALMVLSYLGSMALAFYANPENKIASALAENLGSTWKAGFPFLFGLLGGKAL